MGEGRERLRGSGRGALWVRQLTLCLLGTPTPHLTSPLRGGRDELGKGRERLRGDLGAGLCGYDDWRCACSGHPPPT